MKSTKNRKILIVDDQKLFVSGLRQILESIDGTVIVEEVYHGNDVAESIRMMKPDLIFLDLNLPGKNGLDVLQDIRKTNNTVVVSILSMYSDLAIAKKCQALGANAYLTKDADVNELRKVIFDLKSSGFYLSKQLEEVKTVMEIKEDKFPNLALITSREMEIIRLLIQGNSSAEIGEKLFISAETVKTHRKNIFSKLKVNKLTELIQQVNRYGFE